LFLGPRIMETGKKKNETEGFRELPSVDVLMRTVTGQEFAAAFGHERAAMFAREAVGSLRKEITAGMPADRDRLLAEAEDRLEEALRRESKKGLRKVINATGVIVHTNLGRAPISDAAVEAMARAAAYCDVEYDLETGKRGRRGERAESLAAELTGAEDAIIVNNCAAAAVLVLTSLCEGGEAVISRGELVEIGGDFRVPDVMKRSGATLVEVGTTNRTKLSDFEDAVSEETRLILKVHPSNYRIVGFTAIPGIAELAELAHSRGLLLFEDAGSGAIDSLARFGLGDEPVIRESIRAGADVVTFSGDKLLGSVQSGFIVGRADVLKRIRSHPLYRAFRPGKLTYAALEATLECFLRGTQYEEIPVLRMLSLDPGKLKERTSAIVAELKERLKGVDAVSVEMIEGSSVVGGGSAPAAHPESSLIAISRDGVSANDLEQRLRSSDPPVIGRIENDVFVMDLRTVGDPELDHLKDAVCSALA